MPPTSQIKETINAPGVGRPAVGQVSAVKEYVSGGEQTGLWYSDWYRTLPRLLDDIEQQAGDDVYGRMLQDPQVYSSVNLLKQEVLSQDVQIVPAVSEEDPDYKRAVKMADFCKRCLDRLPFFRTRTLYQLLDAIPYGHKIAEMTYEVAKEGPDRGLLVPRTLKVKDRGTYGLVVDPYMNLYGLLAVEPGQGWGFISGTSTGGSIPGNPAPLPNFIPRGKFVLLSLMGKDANPQGTSWLQPAYQSWYLKQVVLPEYTKYLQTFASPSVVGTLPENATDQPVLAADGSVAVDADGNQIWTRPAEVLLRSLLEFRNNFALAVPAGTTITPMFAYTDGSAFRAGIDLMNREINQAILFQTLATIEAQHQSRAAATTHQDILDRVIQHLRTTIEETIERDLFSRWVELNFGPEWVRLIPKALMSNTAPQDQAKLMVAVAQLFNAKYLDPSQLQELDAYLGVPKRQPEDIHRREEQQDLGLQGQQAALEVTKNPQPAQPAQPAQQGGGPAKKTGNQQEKPQDAGQRQQGVAG